MNDHLSICRHLECMKVKFAPFARLVHTWYLQECPFHSMEAHGHTWVMYHAEPDLWLLLVVGKLLVGPHCLTSSLTGFVKGLHALTAVLHGLLSTQLEQVGLLHSQSGFAVTVCV